MKGFLVCKALAMIMPFCRLVSIQIFFTVFHAQKHTVALWYHCTFSCIDYSPPSNGIRHLSLCVDPDQLSLNGRVESVSPELKLTPHTVALQTGGGILCYSRVYLLHNKCG